MGCGVSRQKFMRSESPPGAASTGFIGSQDDMYSDNMSYSDTLAGVKKKELYMKAEDSKICSWFREYSQMCATELPTYILFHNRRTCVINTFVKNIEKELDKCIHMATDDKTFETFLDVTSFEQYMRDSVRMIVNKLNENPKYENIQEIHLVNKFLKTTNINIYKNSVKPFILYKKLHVKYDIYYVPLSIYGAVKTQTDIIKTIQILELLGCKELYISAEESTQKTKQFLSELNVGFITQKNGVIAKRYTDKQSQRNNSYEFIDKLFSDEDQLLTYIDLNSHIFMDHTDYVTDIELRFLIRSRINSYLQEYSRSFTVKRLDSVEVKTQLSVRKIYDNLGLKLRYNTDTFMEVSFKIDCIFFSLNEIIDTSSLPLDAIGFNIIKNQLFEHSSEIIKYIDKEPRVNATVIATVDTTQRKVFGLVTEVHEDNEYTVKIFHSNDTIRTSGVNIRRFEFNEDTDNVKFYKEVKRFIQKLLHQKYVRYKSYVKQKQERYLNHRKNFVSFFHELCNNDVFSSLLDQIETYSDVKEIICYVKYSAYFVFLNQSGFEKMRQYMSSLNDPRILSENTLMFVKRYLFFNEVAVDDPNEYKKLVETYPIDPERITNFKQIDNILVAIYHDPIFCPLNMCAVNHFFTTFQHQRRTLTTSVSSTCATSTSYMPSSSATYDDNRPGDIDATLTQFIYRILVCVSSKNGSDLEVTNTVVEYVKKRVAEYLERHKVSSLTYDFIQNLYNKIVSSPELFYVDPIRNPDVSDTSNSNDEIIDATMDSVKKLRMNDD